MEPMRIQLVDGEYLVRVAPEAVEALQLKDGDPVRVVRDPDVAESRYIGVAEAMKSSFETEPSQRESYRELAK
jgi:hypothetical protein